MERADRKKIFIKRRTALLLIFLVAGIFFILAGLAILRLSGGRGIVYVLIGILTIVSNSWLLNRPLLVIGKTKFTHYPSSPSKGQQYEISDIMEVKMARGTTLISLTGNRQVRIRNFEMKPQQRAAFEKFIEPYIR